MTYDIPSKLTNFHHSRDNFGLNQFKMSPKDCHWMDKMRSLCNAKLSLQGLASYTQATVRDFLRAKAIAERREPPAVKDLIKYNYRAAGA